MPTPTYERLSGNADEDVGNSFSQSTRTRALPPDPFVRPPVYYGEGPFDAPSSEEGEDDGYLEKQGRSVGLEEEQYGDSAGNLNGLRVGGGNKVSGHTQYTTLLLFICSLPLAADCFEVSHIVSGITCLTVCLYRRVCCNHSLQWQDLPCTRSPQNIARSHI